MPVDQDDEAILSRAAAKAESKMLVEKATADPYDIPPSSK